MSANERQPTQQELYEEGDRMAVGPGVVATKSQTRGGFGGLIVGGVIGAVLGVIVGAIWFGGAAGIAVAAVCFAVAGGTAGGVAGGFTNNRAEVTPDAPADN